MTGPGGSNGGGGDGSDGNGAGAGGGGEGGGGDKAGGGGGGGGEGGEAEGGGRQSQKGRRLWLGTAATPPHVVGDASERRLAGRGPVAGRTRTRCLVETECRLTRPGDVPFVARRKRLTESLLSIRFIRFNCLFNCLWVYHSSAPIGRRCRAVAGALPLDRVFAIHPAVKDNMLILGLGGHRHPARIVCNPGAHHGGALGCTSGLVEPARRRVSAPVFGDPAFAARAQPVGTGGHNCYKRGRASAHCVFLHPAPHPRTS